MDIRAVPAALRGRLGDEATLALLEWSGARERPLQEQILNVAAERFERRLAEEFGTLRVEMAREFASVRQEMAQGLASVRQETAQGFALVCQESAQGQTSVLRELAATRADVIKWSFLFWIGQVAVLSGVIALMLRGLPR